MKKENLTENQQRFIEVLFNEANGDLAKAKELAGYSPNSTIAHTIKPMADHIVEAARDYLARHSAKAAVSLVQVIDQPVALGNRDKLKAATEILDRVGLVKKEIVEHKVEHKSVVILPAKDND